MTKPRQPTASRECLGEYVIIAPSAYFLRVPHVDGGATYLLRVPDVDAVVAQHEQLHVAASRSEPDLPDPSAMRRHRPASDAIRAHVCSSAFVYYLFLFIFIYFYLFLFIFIYFYLFLFIFIYFYLFLFIFIYFYLFLFIFIYFYLFLFIFIYFYLFLFIFIYFIFILFFLFFFINNYFKWLVKAIQIYYIQAWWSTSASLETAL